MEYLLLRNILPAHILKDINDYNKLDKLDMEWYRWLHSQQYNSVLFQLVYTKEFYNREVIATDDRREVLVSSLVSFPEYILNECKSGSLDW